VGGEEKTEVIKAKINIKKSKGTLVLNSIYSNDET
jgi:hypothetical protein